MSISCFFFLFLYIDIENFIYFLTGRAYEDPHLGAAGVIANGYVPPAEGEGETDEYYPQPGVVGTNNPDHVFTKALECLHDKYVCK